MPYEKALEAAATAVHEKACEQDVNGELVERLREPFSHPVAEEMYLRSEAASALTAKDITIADLAAANAKLVEEIERLRDALSAVTVEASHMAMTMRRRKIFDAAARALSQEPGND